MHLYYMYKFVLTDIISKTLHSHLNILLSVYLLGESLNALSKWLFLIKRISFF